MEAGLNDDFGLNCVGDGSCHLLDMVYPDECPMKHHNIKLIDEETREMLLIHAYGGLEDEILHIATSQ